MQAVQACPRRAFHLAHAAPQPHAPLGAAATTNWRHEAVPLRTARAPLHTAAAAGRGSQPLPSAGPPLHLAGLSEEQLAAATAPLGATRVLAGPGSGKTRVLTARVAHLVAAHAADPAAIVAITFTNKAADELRSRLEASLGPAAARLRRAGTFHSLCAWLLRAVPKEVAALAGVPPDFVVADEDKSLALLKKLVREDNPGLKGADVPSAAKYWGSRISAVKAALPTTRLVSATDAVDAALRRRHGVELSPGRLKYADELADWFGRYEAALRAERLLDFDDLLGGAVAALRASGTLRSTLQRRWRFLLVDEFQDANAAQYELLRLLAQEPPDEAPRDVFTVGDPDQAIYGWRGADATNMRGAFERDFPGSQVYRLRDNYRSTERICEAARQVLAGNVFGGAEAPQQVALCGAGPHVEVHELHDNYREAAHVASSIELALARGEVAAGRDVAVLLRTRRQIRLVEQALIKRRIKHVLIGDKPFWQRAEVQDALAYLQLAVRGASCPDVITQRVLNVPRRAIGKASEAKLVAAARHQGVTLAALLLAAIGEPAGGAAPVDAKPAGVTGKAWAGARAFAEVVRDAAAAVATRPLADALLATLGAAQYLEYVKVGGHDSGDDGEAKSQERLDRLFEVLEAAADFEAVRSRGSAAAEHDGLLGGLALLAAPADADSDAGAGGSDAGAGGSDGGDGSAARRALASSFLDEAALYSAADEGAVTEGVRVSTIHAAKGLEFDLVFVPGCVEGKIPLVRRKGVDESCSLELNETDQQAEEARILYVAMTRAKRRLWLLYHREQQAQWAINDYRSGWERSRFLESLDDVPGVQHLVIDPPMPDYDETDYDEDDSAGRPRGHRHSGGRAIAQRYVPSTYASGAAARRRAAARQAPRLPT